MTTFDTGKRAEEVAANFLYQKGYELLERNWRTRLCEIDLIAQKDNCVYFVEVKYRRVPNWGEGLDYITAQKKRQMSFAAELWISNKNWTGECSLSAIEVSGDSFEVSLFLEQL